MVVRSICFGPVAAYHGRFAYGDGIPQHTDSEHRDERTLIGESNLGCTIGWQRPTSRLASSSLGD